MQLSVQDAESVIGLLEGLHVSVLKRVKQKATKLLGDDNSRMVYSASSITISSSPFTVKTSGVCVSFRRGACGL